ncbi:MAG: hypothetical protein QXV81_04960 [Ignisphaera sp.]
MVKVSLIELETFDDIILLLHSRMSAVSMTSSLLCSEKSCFTIVTVSDEQILIISSPPPSTKCKFASVDDQGKVRCGELPPVGRPVVFILNVKDIKETDSITITLLLHK